MDTEVAFYADERDRVYGRPTRVQLASLSAAAAFARGLAPAQVVSVSLARGGRLIGSEIWRLMGLPQVGTEVVHDWATDGGWDPFVGVAVNTSSAQSLTGSVVAGRGRLTAAAGGGASYRKWYLHPGTAGWRDSEVESLWWAGSSYASPNTPQFLHVHRAQPQEDGSWRALVVSNNIFLTNPDRINANVWGIAATGVGDTSLQLGSNGAALTMTGYLDRQLRVFGVERVNFPAWLNEYACLPTHLNGIKLADVVTIDVSDGSTSSPPVTGATFDETNVAVALADPKAGAIIVAEPTTQSLVTYSAAKGTITPPTYQRFWPYRVKSWTEGDVLYAKAWRPQDAEPDDTDPLRVVSINVAGSGQPAPTAAAPGPGPGLSGVGGAHMAESGWLEFASPLVMRRRNVAA